MIIKTGSTKTPTTPTPEAPMQQTIADDRSIFELTRNQLMLVRLSINTRRPALTNTPTRRKSWHLS